MLPLHKRRKKVGRPRMDDKKKAMSAIFHGLSTICQWIALPTRLGASSTVHVFVHTEPASP